MPTAELEVLKDCFVKQLSPLKVYLFGSCAEGTDKPDSDFDFYIIVNDEIKNLKDLTTQAYRSIRKKKNVQSILLLKQKAHSKIKNQVSIQDKFYDYADELTPYGVVVRYPSELFLEEHHVIDALKMADEIIKWGKTTIESL